MPLSDKRARQIRDLIEQSEDIIANPLLTAALVLLAEYYAIQFGVVLALLVDVVPGLEAIPPTTWTLLIFHVVAIGVLRLRLDWSTVEQKAEDAVDEAADDS